MFLCICNNTATTKIYTYRHTLSLRDALPICSLVTPGLGVCPEVVDLFGRPLVGVSIGSGERGTHGSSDAIRSEEHTSELQSLMRISYAVFCLKKKISFSVTSYISSIHYYL